MKNGRLAVGAISNCACQAIVFGTWFLLTPFLLQHLGQAAYGLWILASSIVAYGSLLELGISGAVIRYVAQHRARGDAEAARQLIATALRLFTLLGLVVAALGLVLAPFFPRAFHLDDEGSASAAWLIVLMALTAGVSLPCLTASAVLRALQRYDAVSLLTALGTILSAGLMMLAASNELGPIGLVAANLVATLVMQIPSIWMVNHLAPELRFGWSGGRRGMIRSVLSFSTPLFINNVAGLIQTRTDELVIGTFLPLGAVAPYAVAHRLSEVPHLMANQMLKLLPPLAAELDALGDLVRLRTLYLVGTRLTFAIATPIVVVLTGLAGPFLAIWLGEEYRAAASLVTILAVAGLIDTSQWPAGAVLQGMARHQPLASIAVVAAITNLALSMILVTPLGPIGVALGTLIPTICSCLLVILPYAARTLNLPLGVVLRSAFLPALLPAVPAIALLSLLQHTYSTSSLDLLALHAAATVVVYLAGYLGSGSTRLERQTIVNAVAVALQTARAHRKS